MSNKKSLVSYGSDDEDPPSKRSKTAKIQNSKQSNPDLNDGSQDCIILYETNVREKLKETNDRLIIANKLVKKLQDEVFEHAQKITTLNSVEYKLQQKINILEESNHTLSAQTENERLKVLEISTKYEKLKEDAEKMVEEIEGYKEMAEKYIAKADEEKEAERQRANEAEAKNEELKIQISLLTTTNEMQKFEIIKLQTATATAETLQTCNNNYVQPMVIDKKSRDRIKKEAIRLFETWKINYKNNKNKEIEFQIDHLKKKLKQSEIEKEREIRNGLNNTQKINNLKTERLNLLQTIRKQNCQSFLMAKKSESESTKKIIPGNEKPEKDEGAIEIMKELNIVKENLSELMQQRNNFLAKADSCSSTVTSIGPKWKVSKKLCYDIWKKCHGNLKTFLEEYIDQLFSYSEKLLPEKTLEKSEKWTEVKAIIRHFFASESDEDENETELNLITLKEVMSVKRYPLRQEMYRNCSNFRLCAITSNDKMFYYARDQNDKEFYVPYEDQECQKKLECKNSSVQFGVPKQYESCPFIVIVKDDIQCQQVFKMDCSTGFAKIVWERKKNA